ncbi:MAG: hypothetical protein ACREDT_05045 [Methylocella sp.]
MAIESHQTKSGAKARVVIAPAGAVHIHVSPEVLYNLEATQELTRIVLGRTGCPHCTSGRQLFFQQEEAEFTV